LNGESFEGIKIYIVIYLMHEKVICIGAFLTLFTGFRYIVPYYYEKKEKNNEEMKKMEFQRKYQRELDLIENKTNAEEREPQQDSDEAIKIAIEKAIEAKELEDFKSLSIDEQRLRGLEIFNQEQKDKKEGMNTMHSKLSKYALSVAFPYGTGERYILI
jgi:hypothetical protein